MMREKSRLSKRRFSTSARCSAPAEGIRGHAVSAKHPIIAITGSSGAGTTTVKTTFQQIFRREGVSAASIEGDAFHRYDRTEMRVKMAEAQQLGNQHLSHFGPDTNLFAELETLFRLYGQTGVGKTRKYLHNAEEAAPYKSLARSRHGKISHQAQ